MNIVELCDVRSEETQNCMNIWILRDCVGQFPMLPSSKTISISRDGGFKLIFINQECRATPRSCWRNCIDSYFKLCKSTRMDYLHLLRPSILEARGKIHLLGRWITVTLSYQDALSSACLNSLILSRKIFHDANSTSLENNHWWWRTKDWALRESITGTHAVLILRRSGEDGPECWFAGVLTILTASLCRKREAWYQSSQRKLGKSSSGMNALICSSTTWPTAIADLQFHLVVFQLSWLSRWELSSRSARRCHWWESLNTREFNPISSRNSRSRPFNS